ncbi:MAG: hypothetical protein GY888_30830 [Planctomycetaceae bacterium]|nr:hypothetical protein [Planctomycetaceae bacterium]
MSFRTTTILGCLLLAGICLVTGCKPKQPRSSQEQETAPEAQEQREPTREVAGVGVGKKGRKLEKHKGTGQIIAQPAVSYFRAKEKIIFEIVIPKNMQLFEATNGRYPKSHDEFMKEIVEFGQIQLPELPEGKSYVYDPKNHQLMVETR